MADQFRGARVRVENGVTTVYQIWRANGIASGPFQASEPLSWEDNGSGAGVGVCAVTCLERERLRKLMEVGPQDPFMNAVGRFGRALS